jgi:uncharacterized membrane protein YGL010W
VDHYAESHRNPVNKGLHFLGIPLLLVSTLGLLSKASLSAGVGVLALEPNAAWIALLGACFWYLRLASVMGLPTFVAVAGCYVLGSALPAGVLICLFGVGISAHAIGHYGFEGKPPVLFSRPAAVLEAPAWLLSAWAGL